MKHDLSALKGIVREQLGRDPGRSEYEDLINEAGEAWCNAAEWVYLRDRFTDLEVVSGVESYRLGLGVRNIVRIHRPSTTWEPIRMVDYDYFEQERSSFYGRQGRQFAPIATVQWGQREDDDRPRLYLELFPVNFTETVRVVYEAGWLPLDKESDMADLPGPLFPHFRDWLRMYALQREKEDEYPMMGTMDAFKRTESFMAARRVDGGLHKRVVPRLTGAGRHYARKRVRGWGGIYDRSDIFPFDDVPRLGQ